MGKLYIVIHFPGTYDGFLFNTPSTLQFELLPAIYLSLIYVISLCYFFLSSFPLPLKFCISSQTLIILGSLFRVWDWVCGEKKSSINYICNL